MSDKRYEANIIRATAVEPANNLEVTSAPGVWSIDEVVELQKKEKWPTVGNVATNVENVFSTFLYEGNGSSQAIENNINLGTWATENTVLHLTGDSLNDSSPFSHTVTAVGNTSVNTTTKKYGTGSIYFDGSGDYLRTSSGTYILGTTDFTLEFWAYYADASTTKGIFHLWDGSTTSNYSLALYHAGSEYVFNFKNGVDGTPSGTITSTGGAISNSTWHHVAIVRYDNTLKLYVNGTAVTSGTDVSGYNFVMDDLEIGTHWDSNYTFTGYIDDWRITNGSARYTGNFTPPNAALPLDTTANGEGGLVWIKDRDSGSNSHMLYDTARGAYYAIKSNTTDVNQTRSNGLTAFTSSGFTLGSLGAENSSGNSKVSWTFRKQAKFLDIVTYTGDGNADRQINHNLGSVPGMMIVKKYAGSTTRWSVYHRSLGTGKFLNLDDTAAVVTQSDHWQTAPTATQFTVETNGNVNNNGDSYVAYLFAHNNNDGGFGPTGSDDIIKCGSFTTDGTGIFPSVDLGFEPEFVLLKSATSSTSWFLLDDMREYSKTGTKPLEANAAAAETTSWGSNTYLGAPTATGFDGNGVGSGITNATIIYMAIRAGPLAAPTAGTQVFSIDYIGSSAPYFDSTHIVDMGLVKLTTASSSWFVYSRLLGEKTLYTDSTAAEANASEAGFDFMDGHIDALWGDSNAMSWMWKRAPSYFDVVAYTGTGSTHNVSHNLGVVPEMMWVKRRDTSYGWYVYHKDIGNTKYLALENTDAEATGTGAWDSTTPTSSVFTVGTQHRTNQSGGTFMNYLFATVAGVSKVGSYTGSSSGVVTVDCGFSAGARLVICKRTDAAGSWYLYDSVRGINSSADDPYLLLDTTDAGVTNTNNIEPHSSGFQLTQQGANPISINGGTYIFYAIA
tara:strand:+ start:247 stop:2937 length:2691 start_codon:yes stop_codon:yes gene_type:complete